MKTPFALFVVAALVFGGVACDRSTAADRAAAEKSAADQAAATAAAEKFAAERVAASASATAAAAAATAPAGDKKEAGVGRVEKTPEQWKKEMTELQYHVMREKGTERAGTSPLDKNYDKGTYLCSGCGLELFTSDAKFNSGTGWPSFWKPATPKAVKEVADRSHGMVRTEVVCARCDGHLGHVFDDGPQPTGLRYCMNGVSLKFAAAGDKKDEKK